MKVVRQFCSPQELDILQTLWRSGTGWEARGSYIFTPCLKPPPELVERALPYLPESRGAQFTDSFFIHYVEQRALALHTDARSIVRLNLLVIKPEDGGEFIINGSIVTIDAGDAIVFNPNCEPHGVTKLVSGQRLVWSLGRATNEIGPVKILTRKLRRAAGRRHKPMGFL